MYDHYIALDALSPVGLSDYLHKARGISFDLLKKMEKRAITEGILKKGGYMNFTEEIKKEAKLEGWQKGRQEGIQKVVLRMPGTFRP